MSLIGKQTTLQLEGNRPAGSSTRRACEPPFRRDPSSRRYSLLRSKRLLLWRIQTFGSALRRRGIENRQRAYSWGILSPDEQRSLRLHQLCPRLVATRRVRRELCLCQHTSDRQPESNRTT